MAYFYRTVSSGNGGTKFTLSFWAKKLRNHTNDSAVFGKNSSNNSANHQFQVVFKGSSDDNMLQVVAWNSSGSVILLKRLHNTIEDCSSWFHVVVTIDTTLSTAEDRCKIFINGIRQLYFEASDTSNTNIASQNDTVYPFSTNGSTSYFNATKNTSNALVSESDYYSYAHVITCDGYAYEASSFGEFDTNTYAWNFKGFSGSYGTNGYLLKFDDASNLGTDSSGNGNNLTVSGTAYKITDSPTKNLPVMDNYFDAYRYAPSKGNLQVASTGDGGGSDYYRMIPATQAITGGKFYWEVKILSRQNSGLVMIGLIETDTYTNHHDEGASNTITHNHFGHHTNSVAYYSTNAVHPSSPNDGRIIYGPSNTVVQSGYDAFTTDDVIGVAFDADNGKVYWSKNGTWQNSGDPTSGSTGTGAYSLTMTRTYGGRYYYYPAITNFGTMTVGINFGNGRFGTTALASGVNDNEGIGTFEYTIPSGYRALCVQNIGHIG
tara:strand:+ start:1486 stop:2955 length:1470 start_codon:yes stop_codon:yes gene_type:complete